MELTFRLHAPGMTALHRAGLGGLAATLRALERNVRDSLTPFPADKWPGHPWAADQPPWTIEPHQITLRLGDDPKTFLERLFNYAFQLTKDGLIYLPGQSGGKLPPVEVLAAIQEGILFTFLQHGLTRKLAKDPVTRQYDVGEAAPATVRFKVCSQYKHQELAAGMVKAGTKKKGPSLVPSIEIPGPLYPGAAIRHLALGGDTKILESPDTALPLIFGPIGCLTLVAGRREGVLLVPDVIDLRDFAAYRHFLNPASARDCQISGTADAALQAQIRLRAAAVLQNHDIPSCEAFAFSSLPWSTQQKSRRTSYTIRANDSTTLDRFQIALRCLAPRLKTFERKDKKSGTGTMEAFWTDSVVRPLVAENLALGLPWYQGFTRLMTALDDRKRPLRDLVQKETDQLHQLTKEMTTDLPGIRPMIEAVHSALENRYGRIASETAGSPATMRTRWQREYDRLRLAIAGSRTPDALRTALCGFFAKAGTSETLQRHWADILPLLTNEAWQQTRDLALLGLASYAGKGQRALKAIESESEAEEESADD